MTRHAQAERQALCDTLVEVGPQAPTLCPPWQTRELAAHLAVRDRRPDAAAGVILPPLSSHSDSVRQSYAARGWPELVELVRSGPPSWSPARLARIDEGMNAVEFYVHHEDVRRAGTSWSPRTLTDDYEAALWRALVRGGRLMFRRSPVGVVLVTPSHGRRMVHGVTDRGSVVLRGTPGELTLFAFNRKAVADVAVEGPDEAVAAFSGARLGMA